MSPTDPQDTRESPPRRREASDPKRRVGKTAEERLMILEAWIRSKLSANEFASIVRVSRMQLYA